MNRKQENWNSRIASKHGIAGIYYLPVLTTIAQNAAAGVLMSQLLYWYQKGVNSEWFYKTIEELENETGLGRSAQETAIAKWERLGVLIIELRSIPAKRHFKINIEKLESLITEHTLQFAENRNTDSENSQSITKNTQENTQKNYSEYISQRAALLRKSAPPSDMRTLADEEAASEERQLKHRTWDPNKYPHV